YTVSVNGKGVDVYIAPVYTPDYKVRPFGGPYSFAYFDVDGPVTVTVTTAKPLEKVRILPDSRGIKPKVKGDTLTFDLPGPGQVSVEPDAKNGPLLLFANPLETARPDPAARGVKYFGPGVHKAGRIKLGDGETLYVAGGAIVKGGVLAEGNDITITGRGIIDGLQYARNEGPTPQPIHIRRSRNVRVDGIIVKDAWTWSFVIAGSRDVRVDNVKVIAARGPNNDGIGTLNSRDVTITNCFIRTDDDCITAKGDGWPGRDKALDGWPVDGLTVTGCVLWTDRAQIWRLGCESWAAGMRNMTFTDIDVLHRDGPWLLTVQPAEEMRMENVRFENIRVNGEGQDKLIEVFPAPTKWTRRRHTPGNVRNVLFKDILVTGPRPEGGQGLIKVHGLDAQHTVEGVTFQNVIRHGRRLTQDAPDVQINEFTKDITFK
ncbi:MAG TPA: glycosyl hydrolase family 28 protein, partial [Phycisphaerae bacterium]|nr:glycosyl hydrolase family 28 protein [Phycisphaerae bacterium]